MPDDLRTLTIAEAFAERFENRLEVGDTLALGPATLIATETDGDLLLTAALEFEDDGPGDVIAAAPPSRGSDERTEGSGPLRLVVQADSTLPRGGS